MFRTASRMLVAFALSAFLGGVSASAAPWVAPDWAGKEPTYKPGSLYWRTGEYPTCPILYRTVIRVEQRPVMGAVLQARFNDFGYVFLNGKQIASIDARDAQGPLMLEVELTGLKPGPNVLVISTQAAGFSLDGGVSYARGSWVRFASGTSNWKVQKLAPLTMLEYDPSMQAGFDDAAWFSVREAAGEATTLSDEALTELHGRLVTRRLGMLDEDGRWRLTMLASKGIAIVDWEAHGWSGAGRLPAWVTAMARAGDDGAPAGAVHTKAEALCRYVVLSDDAQNLENHAVGMAALGAPAGEVAAFRDAAAAMRPLLSEMEQHLRAGRFEQSVATAQRAEAIAAGIRKGRLINNLNRCLDNKFGWFDSPAVLDSDPTAWGLTVGPSASLFTSALSPAALISVPGNQVVLGNWDKVERTRIYHRQDPATGPVCAWAMIDGRITLLRPDAAGVVYDAQRHGKLSENWVLLGHDLSRGGHLPTQLVFLQAPTRIEFRIQKAGANEVAVSFARPDVQLFMLRPLAEWRGYLHMADVFGARGDRVQPLPQMYVEQCRLWSRACLEYPVTFSEVFVRDTADGGGLRIADVYNYRSFKDEWGTTPLRLASLPPLATYGLLWEYPGLRVDSQAENLGWRGIWGDHIAARDTDRILYRVPLYPIKRFGGFTSYCYGPTDIGEPGSHKEIESLVRAGVNSFRPQHNNNTQRARDIVNWCWEQGIQQVFNADEKWVPDVVEHFRSLAKQYKEYPADAVAYDLLNEPETRDPRAYRTLIQKVVRAIREHDKTHIIYVETMPPWGPGAAPFPRAAFESLHPTGDPLTIYSFHDYQFRLPPRWPNERDDVRSILTRWIPAFRHSIEQRTPIHIGEFGAFEQTRQSVFTNRCAETMMLDYLAIFDQFGWHWHYYANRGVCRVRRDGSFGESYVQDAMRRYFARGTFNANYNAIFGQQAR